MSLGRSRFGRGREISVQPFPPVCGESGFRKKHRFADVIALGIVNAHIGQHAESTGVLNEFGKDLLFQSMGNIYHRLDTSRTVIDTAQTVRDLSQ